MGASQCQPLSFSALALLGGYFHPRPWGWQSCKVGGSNLDSSGDTGFGVVSESPGMSSGAWGQQETRGLSVTTGNASSAWGQGTLCALYAPASKPVLSLQISGDYQGTAPQGNLIFPSHFHCPFASDKAVRQRALGSAAVVPTLCPPKLGTAHGCQAAG